MPIQRVLTLAVRRPYPAASNDLPSKARKRALRQLGVMTAPESCLRRVQTGLPPVRSIGHPCFRIRTKPPVSRWRIKREPNDGYLSNLEQTPFCASYWGGRRYRSLDVFDTAILSTALETTHAWKVPNMTRGCCCRHAPSWMKPTQGRSTH